MERLCVSVKKSFLEPLFLLLVQWETNQLHGPLASCLTGTGLVDEFDQQLEVATVQRFVVFSGEIECFRDTGAAESCEERFLDLFCRKRRAYGEVVCHDQAVIVFREVREGKGIEDFVWESRNDGGFGQEFNGALKTVNVSLCHYHLSH